jgi:hypothetical protein
MKTIQKLLVAFVLTFSFASSCSSGDDDNVSIDGVYGVWNKSKTNSSFSNAQISSNSVGSPQGTIELKKEGIMIEIVTGGSVTSTITINGQTTNSTSQLTPARYEGNFTYDEGAKKILLTSEAYGNSTWNIVDLSPTFMKIKYVTTEQGLSGETFIEFTR